MPTLLQRQGVLSLASATANSDTPAIPEPALHVFTSPSAERKFENSCRRAVSRENRRLELSWTITTALSQTHHHSRDIEATAVGIGSGRLLLGGFVAKKMVSTELRGARPAPRLPHLLEQNDGYSYGLGIARPAIGCQKSHVRRCAVEAHLPSQRAPGGRSLPTPPRPSG